MNQEERGKVLRMRKGSLANLAKVTLDIEKTRVAQQVRLTHLAKVGGICPDTEVILTELLEVEATADKLLAERCIEHCTWFWAKRINGAGTKVYARVIGLIEKFGRYYEIGHPDIPVYVNRLPEKYLKIEKGKTVERVGIWVKGIERLENISKMRKYEGYSVNAETGEIQKKKKGHKLDYNADLRMSLYRLGVSLSKQRGIWFTGRNEEGCSRGYEGWKDKKTKECEERGIKIVSTPKVRICPECGTEVTEKATHFCPKDGARLIKKSEPPGYLYVGHLHLWALRKMMIDFSTCMWVVWRTAEGLPVTEPFNPPNHIAHKIDPWKMVDK